MIISASRRTDIPAFYWDWFLMRMAEGYVLSRNPLNAHQVRRVDLLPGEVDGFVFWTKNPMPAMDRLAALDGWAYYFQFTLTPYGPDVEPHLPPKAELMDAMARMIDTIGPERVQWRYDPILLSAAHPLAWHEDQFQRMTERMKGQALGCTISFLDEYRKIARRLDEIGARTPDEGERLRLAHSFAAIAGECGIRLSTCVEGDLYRDFGIAQASCVDAARLSRIAGRSIQAPRDRNQRPGCACAASVDIGAYDSCPHGCRYCYANVSQAAVAKKAALHDPSSPLLIGQPDGWG